MLSPVAKLDAIQYLLGPMPHAQAIGLSPSFIRELIEKAGAHLDTMERDAEVDASSYLADREARRAAALARKYEAHLKSVGVRNSAVSVDPVLLPGNAAALK